MSTYTYPGVYIKEVPKGPGPVQGVSASTCAMIGFTEEGVVDQPTLVTSFPEFVASFGNFTTSSRLPTSAFAFFQNGGQNLVVVRTVGDNAEEAKGIIDEPYANLTSDVAPAPNGNAGTFTFNLEHTPIVPGSLTFTFNGNNYTSDASGVLTFLNQPQGNSGSVNYQTGAVSLTVTANVPLLAQVQTITYKNANITFCASSPGIWGNGLQVVLEGDDNSVDANDEYTLFNLIVERLDDDGNYVPVEVINGINFDEDSASFIQTLVNDDRRGSDLITIVAGSSPKTPAGLRDRQKTALKNSAPAIDGTSQQLTYTLGEPVNSNTLRGEIVIGDTFVDAINNNQSSGFTIPNFRDVTGQTSINALITYSDNSTELLTFNQAQAGTAMTAGFEKDADANNAQEGLLKGNIVIQANDGSYAINLSNNEANAPTIANITWSWIRADKLIVEDDGTNELVVVSAPVGLSLNPNGENKIDLATGEVKLHPTFAQVGSLPERGPAPVLGLTGEMSFTYTVDTVATQLSVALTGGADGGALTRGNVSNPTLAGDEKGLYSLNKTEALLNVCIPDFASNTVVSQDLIDYCETRKDRFAIISVPEGFTYKEAIEYKRNTLLRNSNRCAIYYPHLKLIDPISENEINFPAVGHMAGIYARTDSTRNVSKAPAGTVDGRLAFASGVEVELTPQQAGFVNTAHINNLVSWPFTGLVAWGARTLEANGDFPYIQMRRLFMFVEKSVFNATQGFVFESNTAGLRASIKLQIEAFLLSLHRSGHFAGTSPAQSFFVICDTSNNPQNLIDQGQLTVDVGIAPTKPAEFIIFRFQQKTIS